MEEKFFGGLKMYNCIDKGDGRTELELGPDVVET